MKRLVIIVLVAFCATTYAQVDRDQLSLDISKADAANTEQLKAFLWKKHSVVTVDGDERLTTVDEISISEDGKPQITNIDSDSDVKQQRGIRGRIQANATEQNLDYVEDAIHLAIGYTYLTKGQMLDFFTNAEITEKDGIIEATGINIFKNGDKLTIQVEKETKLFVLKKFHTNMDGDPISGEIHYKKFTTGINHVDHSVLNLPAKGAVINSENREYVMQVR